MDSHPLPFFLGSDKVWGFAGEKDMYKETIVKTKTAVRIRYNYKHFENL